MLYKFRLPLFHNLTTILSNFECVSVSAIWWSIFIEAKFRSKMLYWNVYYIYAFFLDSKQTLHIFVLITYIFLFCLFVFDIFCDALLYFVIIFPSRAQLKNQILQSNYVLVNRLIKMDLLYRLSFFEKWYIVF